MQHNCSDGGVWPACYGRRRNDLPRLILFFVAAKENSSACSGRSSDDLPRPILISVATAENGPPAEVVSAKKNGFAYPCRNNAPHSIFLKYT